MVSGSCTWPIKIVGSNLKEQCHEEFAILGVNHNQDAYVKLRQKDIK